MKQLVFSSKIFLMLKFQPNSNLILDPRQCLRQELYRVPRPMEQNGSKAMMEKRLNPLPSANQNIMEVAANQSHRYL